MVFSLGEIVDMLVMTAVLGFLFKDSFRASHQHSKDYDPLTDFSSKKFFSKNYMYAIYVTAPAIIMHELGHKFVGMAMGLRATFHASYEWLLIGIVLKVMKFPFLFFIPGYVEIGGRATPLQVAITAFAGPLMNISLWLLAIILIRSNINSKYKPFLIITKKVNLFLFFFNMIPLGIFDGAKVVRGLVQHFA